MRSRVTPLRWEDGEVLLLDQRVLPGRERWVRCRGAGEVADAIAAMVVRGAPAIGIAAAYGLAAAVARGEPRAAARARLLAARPTAVNLARAIERLDPVPDAGLLEAARALHEEDARTCRALGEAGAAIVPGGGFYTHCNTGALATGGWGTALGIARSIHAAGRPLHVWAGETRPYLQGARLTAWECLQDGLPCTVVVDGAAAALMASGRVDVVVVGCDRVARNGDTANKIGTYGLALLARQHGIPFYVAMPWSTYDPDTPDGAAIPIEERQPEEVLCCAGRPVAPEGVGAWNPAFDVTPARWITGWITETGPWSPGAAPPR